MAVPTALLSVASVSLVLTRVPAPEPRERVLMVVGDSVPQNLEVQRLTDAATGKSLEAIRRVRGQIRDRLGEDDDDAWN